MNNKVRSFLCVTFLTGSLSLFAQEKKTITLSEAVELSLKNSKQLKNSKAKIDEAVAAVK
jgi:outer membrane protein